MPDECQVPPPGWRCTRVPGHPGPCAALPSTGHDVAQLLDLAVLRKYEETRKQLQEDVAEIVQHVASGVGGLGLIADTIDTVMVRGYDKIRATIYSTVERLAQDSPSLIVALLAKSKVPWAVASTPAEHRQDTAGNIPGPMVVACILISLLVVVALVASAYPAWDELLPRLVASGPILEALIYLGMVVSLGMIHYQLTKLRLSIRRGLQEASPKAAAHAFEQRQDREAALIKAVGAWVEAPSSFLDDKLLNAWNVYAQDEAASREEGR